ncbi:hypothetical protein FACS1894184_17760 [Clostridia bacterium]|nr:hypothetical protein FACS1894184_17760 [Clostridia bacterium]
MAIGTKWDVNEDATVSASGGARIRNVADSNASSASVLYLAPYGTSLYLSSVTTGADGYYWYWCMHNTDSTKPQGYVRCDVITGSAGGGSTGGGSTGGGSIGGGSTGGGSTGGTGVNTASWNQVLAGSAVYRKETSLTATCEGVKILQQYLKRIGYGSKNLNADIVIDGNYGATTETAVKYFQTECALSSDGVVGKDTSNKLEAAQSNNLFTNPDFYPLSSSSFTYNSFSQSDISLIARIVTAEHGYAGSAHYDARVGVAKVIRNRKVNGGVTLYDNSKTRDFRNVIWGSGQYTTSSSSMAFRVARGTTAFSEAVSIAQTIVSGGIPTAAPLVTTSHLFQKGAGAYKSSDTSRAGFCRYPASGSNFSFFYI